MIFKKYNIYKFNFCNKPDRCVFTAEKEQFKQMVKTAGNQS